MYDPGLKRGWHHTDVKNRPKKMDVDSEWNKASIIKRFKMRMQMRHIVVQTHDGLKIVPIEGHKKHSHEVCVAPPHFRPGDEEFIKKGARGVILFDHDGQKIKREHKHAEKKRISGWNEKSPLERFKHKLKGEK